MPVILGVIFMFIYLAMFGYDRCVIQYVSQMACERAVCEDSDKNIEEYILTNLPGMLICSRDISVYSNSDKESVSVEVNVRMMPFDRVFVHKARAVKLFYPKY